MTSRFALAAGSALLAATLAATLVAAPGTAAPATSEPTTAAAGKARVTNACFTSVPDPGKTEDGQICYTLFKPAGATRKKPVPMIMHSHGWGGSRARDPAAFSRWLDAGYAVVSFDQRGFGESGGQAQVMNPAYEGRDVRKLVRIIAGLRWVKQDGRNDPRLGAIGGSYGGGYQFLGAFTELARRGKPVFDALAPEITWHDLSQSLAPEGVVRTEWALALSAAALPTDALPPRVYKALVEGAATGFYPDGSTPGTENLVEFFRKNGPAFHVSEGRRLDIPVLFGQGTTDTLFNLQQGIANWQQALTPKARSKSMFVAYNGGHVLPAIFPQGVAVTSDPCSAQLAGGTFEDLARQFMDRRLKKKKNSLTGYGRYHLATPGGACITVDSVEPTRDYAIGTVTTTTAVGVPLSTKIADGPLRVAGSPYLTGRMTALAVNNRAFYGLAIGTSPADAKLVQNNVLPVNELTPIVDQPRRVTLPSVAVDVPAGQSLFLLATPISDTFVGMSSRVAGAISIANTVVHVPVH
ncbi:MAG: alpha/beta hydrolase family protein [Nocardioides sp.]